MFGPKTPTVDEQRQAAAEAGMTALTLLTPLFDTADGMRTDLLRRGWSEPIVEHIAGAWLASVLVQGVTG
ncbi:hypothetical protein [Streptomyces sp. NPDC058272]|uniref:hypothetical protein n=1 Tax=Streptomyces sp. NPDC058272 TaxID=3346415 RepID=UPI0036EAF8DD